MSEVEDFKLGNISNGMGIAGGKNDLDLGGVLWERKYEVDPISTVISRQP